MCFVFNRLSFPFILNSFAAFYLRHFICENAYFDFVLSTSC